MDDLTEKRIRQLAERLDQIEGGARETEAKVAKVQDEVTAVHRRTQEILRINQVAYDRV